jgi:hypothetical protein
VRTYKNSYEISSIRKKSIPEAVAVISSYPRLPHKFGDPVIPTISCTIGSYNINNALSDLGAGVSVMPYSLYKNLNLREYSHTSTTLQIADKTIKRPVGMIEDVLIKIDQHDTPTDFIILEMSEDEKLCIILGRPFFSTAGC